MSLIDEIDSMKYFSSDCDNSLCLDFLSCKSPFFLYALRALGSLHLFLILINGVPAHLAGAT